VFAFDCQQAERNIDHSGAINAGSLDLQSGVLGRGEVACWIPEELQVALGARTKGYGRIADVGEECNPTDVVGDGPDRCVWLGGLSGTSALVAYTVGGYAGQPEVAASYVHTKSSWMKSGEGNIGYPNHLGELDESPRYGR
jgi:hypothetical protein